MIWQNIRKWIIRKYEEESQSKIENLVWVKRKVMMGETIDWAFVDTVDYDIDSIPRKRELVLEFKANLKEVAKKCQNLLS